MLTAVQPVITPDVEVPLRLYGTTIAQADLTRIPSRDLPAGLPAWMCELDAWAVRTGATAQLKRATISVTVPTAARTWPPVD